MFPNHTTYCNDIVWKTKKVLVTSQLVKDSFLFATFFCLFSFVNHQIKMSKTSIRRMYSLRNIYLIKKKSFLLHCPTIKDPYEITALFSRKEPISFHLALIKRWLVLFRNLISKSILWRLSATLNKLLFMTRFNYVIPTYP